jgi:hypothetical protein
MQERFTARLRAKLRARVKVRQDVVSMYTVEKRIAYEEKKQYLNETGSGMLSIPFNRTLITASYYLALLLFTAPTNPSTRCSSLKIRSRSESERVYTFCQRANKDRKCDVANLAKISYGCAKNPGVTGSKCEEECSYRCDSQPVLYAEPRVT